MSCKGMKKKDNKTQLWQLFSLYFYLLGRSFWKASNGDRENGGGAFKEILWRSGAFGTKICPERLQKYKGFYHLYYKSSQRAIVVLTQVLVGSCLVTH